jgi:hypothetical protein
MVNPDVITGQVTASIVAAYAIQAAKKSKLIPWINAHSYTLNKIAGVVVSAATAVGVHMRFDNDTLTITGLSIAGIMHAAWAWAQSYVVQQFTYDTAIAPTQKLDVMAQPPLPPAPSVPPPAPSQPPAKVTAAGATAA